MICSSIFWLGQCILKNTYLFAFFGGLYARSHFVFEMVNTEGAASGAQEGGERSPLAFLEIEKKCPDFAKKEP